MQEYKVQICRPWKMKWEDLVYGEEVELANIVCQQCAGLDAKAMNEKDFKILADRCHSEIFRKIGIVKGKIPFPICNDIDEHFLSIIAVKDSKFGVVGSFACLKRQDEYNLYVGEDTNES